MVGWWSERIHEEMSSQRSGPNTLIILVLGRFGKRGTVGFSNIKEGEPTGVMAAIEEEAHAWIISGASKLSALMPVENQFAVN